MCVRGGGGRFEGAGGGRAKQKGAALAEQAHPLISTNPHKFILKLSMGYGGETCGLALGKWWGDEISRVYIATFDPELVSRLVSGLGHSTTPGKQLQSKLQRLGPISCTRFCFKISGKCTPYLFKKRGRGHGALSLKSPGCGRRWSGR